MTFKMSFDDFQLLSAFMERKAKGSNLKIDLNPSHEHRLLIQVETQVGETATITFFDAETSKFAEITVTNRLGDAL